jgi:hypothetical protein
LIIFAIMIAVILGVSYVTWKNWAKIRSYGNAPRQAEDGQSIISRNNPEPVVSSNFDMGRQ